MMPPSEEWPGRRAAPPADEAVTEHESDLGANDELGLRVSVGTLARVLFDGAEDERTMIALERTATARDVEGRSDVAVVAKPFGGGVRIVDPAALRDAIGEFRYDSDRSRREGDFRIQIRPSSWDAVKEVCRSHLGREAGGIVDTSPECELAEEFGDVLGTGIEPSQYRLHPVRMLVADTPRATSSGRAPGHPTVRIYYVFEVWLEDTQIVGSILESTRTSDGDLRMAALRQADRGGRGRANAALVFGLDELTSTYLALPRDRRDGDVTVRGHRLAGNVSAVLDGVDAPGYEIHHFFRG
ncbi:MAG: hypothetical protein LJF04_14105 [Gemmatimonadetes bacterium]|nr:hypothetical protein [Gemmatimonadota bacterium]